MVGISADFYVLGYLTSQLKISLFIQYFYFNITCIKICSKIV